MVETERTITSAILQNYLSYVPTERMPAVVGNGVPAGGAISDRELLLKALSMGQMISEMRQEINDLRQMVSRMAQGAQMQVEQPQVVSPSYLPAKVHNGSAHTEEEEFLTPEIIEDESIALEDRERVAIMRALEKHQGSRKLAAADLHISERTLYRKLKEYNIE